MKEIIKKVVPRKLINLGSNLITFFAAKVYRLKFPHLTLRSGETDTDVFRNIFLMGEFKLPIKVNPRFIVDAGAYTGLSALYYSSKYPTAKIVAIEPEASNFSVLEKNTKHLSNVSRINAGVWDKVAYLKISDRGTGKWGFRVDEVSESEDYDIKAVTIGKVLEESEFDYIDILKLDIEGSEKQVLSSNYKGWLNRVNIIVIELHDRIYEGCTETLYAAINQDDWKEYKEGEKVILIRKEYYEAHKNK